MRNSVAKQVGITEDGALAVYVDEGNNQWRFSFIAIEYKVDQTNKIIKDETTSKRYTYLLGENTQTRTAIERFKNLNKQSTLDDLKTAFAVESLNKEFYAKLYKWYVKAQSQNSQVTFPNDEQAQNHTQTSLIRLLTRLLFVWFLKEKKLINADLFKQAKLEQLINWQTPSSFYKAILQNLFFATLNRPIKDRGFRRTTNGKANATNYLAASIYRYQTYFKDNAKPSIMALFVQTPFLNGGLFECLDREATDEEKQAYANNANRPVKSAIRIDGFSDKTNNELQFDNQLFFNTNEQNLGLISLFDQYQFTVEESTPLDIEVALDPELLGKVFENLLATYNPKTGDQARKDTGSFYTPREIVSYMVDEGLKQHFATHRLCAATINSLFIEAENSLDQQQIKTVITAIDSLKILDPAVGSGAYPMGILQRLVFILEKIDPENKYFKQQQLSKAHKIPDEISKNASIEAIEKVFSKQNCHNAYSKKLMLIENCIYGVDIQPIAIQIAKLRFFISLTIEQQPNNNENDNYGIHALPNLETKFIVANSLLPLGDIAGTGQAGLFDAGIVKLQQQLATVRHQYFTAKTLTTKRKYRQKDKQLREEMLKTLQQSGISPEIEKSMQKVVHWDLYNQNSIADWFDPEWMFGVKAGFGLVLGNPPYIRQEKIKQWKPQFERDYKVFTGRADIYTYFYEKGVNLLSKNGHLCYITSNKWMRAKYGQKLRHFFIQQTQLKQIIDFVGKQIFENATVDTNILLCGNGNKTPLEPLKLHYQHQLPDKKHPLLGMNIVDLSVNSYTLATPEKLALKKKIERIGTPLKEWDIKIYIGVLTGFNKAFIIDTITKDALINQDPNSAKIIKPILRGRDIKAYEHKWAGLWVIATFPVLKLNIDNYPAVKSHLLSFGKDRLEQSGKKLANGGNSRKKTGNKWFETQDQIGYHAEFEKEKIVYSEIVKKPQFYFDNAGYYAEATSFIMSGENLKFLIALVHSNLITYVFKSFYAGGGLGKEGYRYKKAFFEQLPIPKIPQPDQQPFIDLVDKIIQAKQNDQPTTDLEEKIDKLVYQLYHLTDDEIGVIEG